MRRKRRRRRRRYKRVCVDNAVESSAKPCHQRSSAEHVPHYILHFCPCPPQHAEARRQRLSLFLIPSTAPIYPPFLIVLSPILVCSLSLSQLPLSLFFLTSFRRTNRESLRGKKKEKETKGWLCKTRKVAAAIRSHCRVSVQ